jgi:hypothetical protein
VITDMAHIPHPECDRAPLNMHKLVGCTLGSGWRRRPTKRSPLRANSERNKRACLNKFLPLHRHMWASACPGLLTDPWWNVTTRCFSENLSPCDNRRLNGAPQWRAPSISPWI